MRGFISILGLAAFVSLASVGAARGSVAVAPAPEGGAMSTDYAVKVNGEKVPVYIAPVWYPDYVKPFGGPYSFATFDFSGEAKIEITTDKPLDKVAILPESRGVRPTVSGKTLSFILKKPCPLSVEPDAKNGPLLLFANPMERNVPKRDDPKVKYFGPGVHQAGAIELKDGETLYLAPGAVVRGGVHAVGKNIRICGRGILDGGSWERFKGPCANLIQLERCSNVTVEGIILKDSWSWTFVVTGSQDVKIENVKICSARCENNDGLDVVNSSRVTLADSFIRSDDDCIAPKGLAEWLNAEKNPPPVEDFTVERCSLWTDRAHIWRLACESRASAMRRLVFRDIDVLHYVDPTNPAIIVQPAEGMLMEDVRFENIRIHHEGQTKFIVLDPHPTIWAKTQSPGTLRNVVFKDISLSGGSDDPGSIVINGADLANPIEDVLFKNVLRHGKRTLRDSPEIHVSGEVKNLRFE